MQLWNICIIYILAIWFGHGEMGPVWHYVRNRTQHKVLRENVTVRDVSVRSYKIRHQIALTGLA